MKRCEGEIEGRASDGCMVRQEVRELSKSGERVKEGRVRRGKGEKRGLGGGKVEGRGGEERGRGQER